jgi:hypothetical protein
MICSSVNFDFLIVRLLVTDSHIKRGSFGGPCQGEQVDGFIDDPASTGEATDKQAGNDGKPRNEPATVYVDKDGNYVVVNNKTGEIIQVGTRDEPRDKPPHERPAKEQDPK